MENTDKQHDIRLEREWLKPYQFKKGQSGNVSGRPKGKTLKEYARERLSSMTDDEREDFLNGISKEFIWRMAEGNPQNGTEHSGSFPTISLILDEIESKETWISEKSSIL